MISLQELRDHSFCSSSKYLSCKIKKPQIAHLYKESTGKYHDEPFVGDSLLPSDYVRTPGVIKHKGRMNAEQDRTEFVTLLFWARRYGNSRGS